MSSNAKTVLIVEDDYIIAMGNCDQVEDLGHSCCGTASSAEEAIAKAREHRPELVLMDMRLDGELDGVDAALAISEFLPAKIIFVTGSKEPSTVARIELAQPSGLIFKPFSSRELEEAIAKAFAGETG